MAAIGKWILLSAAAFGLAGLVACSSNPGQNENGVPETAEQQLDQRNAELAATITSMSPREHPESYVSLTQSWRRDREGTGMIANLTIANHNDFAVKDVAIHCGIAARSGINIGSVEKTITGIVPPGQEKTFTDVDFGFVSDQAKSASCLVQHAAVAN